MNVTIAENTRVEQRRSVNAKIDKALIAALADAENANQLNLKLAKLKQSKEDSIIIDRLKDDNLELVWRTSVLEDENQLKLITRRDSEFEISKCRRRRQGMKRMRPNQERSRLKTKF
jgi:hypothetical protein